MSANAQHFATVVLEAFKAAKHFSVEQVVAAGGPSTTTMTKLRKASEGHSLTRPRGDTMRKIDVAAKWPDGSAEVLWETGALPDQATTRAIGSGGVPAPGGGIVSSETKVERLDDRVLYRARTVAVDAEGRETALELVYEPGSGREVNLLDLGPVASAAHREAMRWTYLSGTRVAAGAAPRFEGGDGDAGSSPQNRPPGSGPDSALTDADLPTGTEFVIKRYLNDAKGDAVLAVERLADDGAKKANLSPDAWHSALEWLIDFIGDDEPIPEGVREAARRSDDPRRQRKGRGEQPAD